GGWAGRRSSSPTRPASSSTHSTKQRSSARSSRRRPIPSRMWPRERRLRCTTSGGRRSGWRRFSFEPFEIGESDLDERTHRLLEPGRTCNLERLLVALAHLSQVDPLLEPVVPRQQQLLDLRARTRFHPHVRYASVRVLIVDDEPLFAEALELLLSADERIE